ncbi:hypothetical protein GCM10020331_056620 [Ectobacillus funiculus]
MVTTVAIAIGLLAANLFQPGTGLNMNKLQESDISKYEETMKATENPNVADIIVHLVPKNVFESIAQGDLLPVIFLFLFLA